MNILEIAILTPVFIILLVICFNSLNSALSFGKSTCLVLSVCVSVLSVIGMLYYLHRATDIILLPYVALALAILLVLLLLSLGKHLSRRKERFSRHSDKRRISEIHDNHSRKRIQMIRKQREGH